MPELLIGRERESASLHALAAQARDGHGSIVLLAVGRTNREIAGELFVSTRTVDMHVRNLLRKLECRSRADAARRASELGLLASA